ncbi:uncharacterized protein LACBIDRAFT_312886 [Laccaria bicolor S238N-H82]|uniref:arginine--tRNA ligase n=1 Tax=Laccaria bicolor (strain S238N-H82 / ATCC MYA-4686) TaxID=486041 RepID=B0DX17_LACBS|nr:uncharacterized protein LACBIDRAFT_312886 [Laccaria bicolor S238N-H82]EDR00911.1 predicted protein [Laccaria bicolor S238N-H82]|eukprot:XP_001888505.1 predicted protein [Laccaria bicolor S238N-H82]
MSQLPILPDTNPVFDSFRISIAKRLSDTLPLTVEQAFAGVDYGKKGEDFTVALPRFRLPGKVAEIAATVIEGFQPDEWIESIVLDRSFLHFRVNTTNMICQVLNQVNALTHLTPSGQPEYGSNDSGKGKRVIIEYSSPNIVKEFHLGHLRSTIIGAFLANLYKACGWEVISMNYLGDWGTQFGMVATGYEKYGSQEEFDQDPIMHLYNVYVKVTKDLETDPKVKVEAARWFKRMEDGDEDVLKKWHGWRETSLEKYQEAYDQLNIKFDVYTGESNVSKESMDKALVQLQDMGLISDRDSAKEVDLNKWNLKAPIVRKTDGTSTYLTRDIGGAIERYERYKFDKMIYVVGAAQDFHLAQFFKIVELMGFPWAKNLLHINYGMVQGMRTRKGTAVFLDRIIKKAGNVMHEQMKKNDEKYAVIQDPQATSLEIGITGIKIQDMAAKRINDYTFNWDRMLSFEGDTGPYLQYAHSRLASIGRKNPQLLPLPPTSQIATHALAQYSNAREIAFLLGTYPDVVNVALKTHEPSGVVTFAFKLAHAISTAWDRVIVKGEEDVEKARAKMYLYECAKEVLAAAMRLLSIRPLERM